MPGLLSDLDSPQGQGGPSICIIGAGFSGICAAIRIRKDLNFENFQIFEMNKELGGTWLSNSYPGAACDVPIHVYCLGFEKRNDWRAQYATQKEILDYMKEVSAKYDLNRRIHFSHKIKRMTWDKEISQWIVDIEDLKSGQLIEKTFDFVFNGSGSLRSPKVPDEFKAFKGQIVHTAMWNDSMSLENKKVGVIGTGASGIQVIPQIAKVAKKLVVYQRTPSWVFPKYDFEFHSLFKWLLKVPGLLTAYRFLLFYVFEFLFFAMTKDSLVSKLITSVCNRHRKSQLKGNTYLYEKLTPKYDLGCRRTGFAQDYFPTFLRPNTLLVTGGIQKVTEDSIITSEGEEKIDVLVLATGFKVSDFFAPMEMYDKNGDNVLVKWKKEGPSLFMGIAANDLPNLFILFGPNTSTGHNSVVVTIEMQMDFAVKCIREKLRRNARVVAIKKSVETSYMKEMLDKFPKMVWSAANCNPWYADERGVIVAIYPGNLISYNKRIKNFDLKNLEFE